MCGLVGLIAKRQNGFFYKEGDILQQMLYADAIRGWDATGVFGVNKYGNVDIKKAATAASMFVTTPEFETFKKDMVSKYHIVVGHNRKATHGEKNSEDAHPFWDKEEKICLVHNGMISNHKEFCDESTVDSNAICNALAKETTKEIFKNIQGAYAFIWYDVTTKKVHFIRNKDRPLYILETDDTFMFSSEHGLSHWIAGRNNVTINSTKLLKEDTLYTIGLEDKKLVEEETIEKKQRFFPILVPTPTPQTTMTRSRTGGQDIVTEILSDGAPNSYFRSTTDYPDPASVMYLLKRDDKILVTIDTYEESSGTHSMELTLSLANVDRKFIKIYLYVSKGVFAELNLTAAYQVNICGIHLRDGIVTIYANKPIEETETRTYNDFLVTENMWFDDRFPIECDSCKQQIKFKDLPQSGVIIEQEQVTTFICPSCRGEKSA